MILASTIKNICILFWRLKFRILEPSETQLKVIESDGQKNFIFLTGGVAVQHIFSEKKCQAVNCSFYNLLSDGAWKKKENLASNIIKNETAERPGESKR